MSKELFSLATYGKCRYQMKVVEKSICLRVARRAVRAAGYSGAFEQATGRSFSGTGADRTMLPPEIGRRVDAALCKSMRRYPRAWRKSPVGNVALDRPEAHNLILNQGLDYLGAGTTNWGSLGTYCVLGSGTTTPATSQTGLDSEIVRTNKLLTSGNSTTDTVGTRTRALQRTYDFPEEMSGKVYAELGLSHTATKGNNLSTRALIDGGTVAVATGQQARVVYTVSITLGGNVVATPTSTTGWTAGLQGTSAYCTFSVLPLILSTGYVIEGLDRHYLLKICTGSTIPTFGTNFTPGTAVSATSGEINPYSTGSYKRTRTCSWSLSSAVGTWRSFAIGANNFDWCWVFDNAQTKDNAHILTVTWSMTYGRA